ncbi:DUF6734 family protein [Aquimarina brevivitae]|uniref:DUF6734 domain-containing protein n=1 Tax=Aquimarina brevivitae TaxID=323412 RepID=A0A4Q7NYK1_9FLAO|nr:DUF6734 family protein [Aquimarina brevivitae]RZS92503.1 hypothetical protein EV197_2641 [Aquimarina brevivitae]
MHNEPKIIFSLDAYPLVNNRWYMGNKLKETIYMTALSVLYAHLWYKDIELFVDKTAYKFLYMLPCRVTKMNIEPDKEVWVRAKIHAIERQNVPFVHLDNDVFIKKKIDFNFNKVLLERREGGYTIHYKPQLDFFNPLCSHMPYWNPDLGHSYSCGVLGFNELSLRNKFVNAYYQVERQYLENRTDFTPFKIKGYEPCIVIEQYNLACLLDHYRVKPNVVLRGYNVNQHATNAKDIGYSHLFGLKKYHHKIEQEIEHRLYRIFPYWYAQVKIALEKHKVIPKQQVNGNVA